MSSLQLSTENITDHHYNMSEHLHIYLVSCKADDYGRCLTELVETTVHNSKEYYNAQKIAVDDVETLSKYFDIVEYSEEMTRSDDRRFYGGD